MSGLNKYPPWERCGGENMSEYDNFSGYGESAWPSDYSPQGFGAMPPQQYLTPSQEMKRKGLKKTKIGLALLMGAVGCQIASLLLSPVPCLNSLLRLGALGLGISAYILLLIGAKAIEKPHKMLVITSMVIIGIAVFITIVAYIIVAMGAVSSLIGSASDTGISGEGMRDYMETIRMIAFVGIVPSIAIAVAYAMVVFKLTKKWGKTLLGVYIGLAVIGSIAGAFITYSLLGDVIDTIDASREYDDQEIQDIQQEQIIKSWIGSLIRAPEYIVYLVAVLGAFLNVKKMEEDSKPKLDSRLYDIRL